MRVAVTGHRGYVGVVLSSLLEEAGHDVIGFDTDLYRGSTFGPSVPFKGVSVEKDIRDLGRDDLDGCDAMLHLAGLSNDPLGDLDPQLTDEINHHASVRLAELCRASSVERFVFSSSCSNYGAGVQDWLDEESAFNPVTPYGRSKVDVEHAVALLATDDFSPTFLRSGTAYGVSSRLRFDLVLNNLTAWAYCTKQVLLKSDGSAWRPMVHIEDMSRAFVAALEAPREIVHNEAFNVGRTSENYRIRDLAEFVAAAVPGSTVEFAGGAGTDLRNYRVNCDKIASVLSSFQPVWTSSLGVEELRDAYEAVGLVLDEFEGPRFRRVDHIRQLIAEGRLGADLRWIQASGPP